MRIGFIILIILVISCRSTNKVIQSSIDLEGEYVLDSDKMFQAYSELNYHSLIFNTDGTYILNKAEIKFTPVIEQCNVASKGKWSLLSNNVLELTSEDKFEKQKGLLYEINMENKLSQDSLYIQVKFPTDFNDIPVKMNFTFNSNNSKSIQTDDTLIVLPKENYLRSFANSNRISFSLTGGSSNKSRSIFEIFEEDIDTKKSNYLTINLPNFDRCFFEFEPLNQDLIYIKSKNQLFWQGENWIRKK